MTDHSTISQGVADVPFQREAEFLRTNFRFVFATLPRLMAQAVACSNLYETVSDMNDAQLSAMNLSRTDIARYVAHKSGLI